MYVITDFHCGEKLFSSTIKIAVYAEAGIPSSVNRDNIGDFSEIKRKDNARIRASLKIYAWLYIRENL